MWGQETLTLGGVGSVQLKGDAQRRKRAYVRPSERPATEFPHPGQSYLPNPEAHKEAVSKAVKGLQELDRREQAAVRFLNAGKDGKGAFAEALAEHRRRLREGVEDEDEGEGDEALPKRKQRMKTRQERNKEKKKRQRRKQLALAEAEKKRWKDVERIAAIKEDMTVEADRRAERRKRRKDRQEAFKGFRVRRMGTMRYRKKPMMVVPPSELGAAGQHSLRVSKSRVNPLVERFNAMKECNMIPHNRKTGIPRFSPR